MGIKLIETQVAIHRTPDLGKIQAQHNNQGMNVQALLAEQRKKQDEIRRKKVLRIQGEDKEKINSTKKNKQQHPHKGTHFDIRG